MSIDQIFQGERTLSDFAEKEVWTAWRTEPRGDTVTKVPYRTKKYKAKSDDPKTWLGIETAYRVSQEIRGQLPDGKYGFGIFLGFDIDEETRLGGIDLDTCIIDGEIEPWAQEIIARLNTYGEISPSLTGVKVLFSYRKADHIRLQEEGVLRQGGGGTKVAHNDEGGGHPPAIEMYLKGRYFATTGKDDGLPQFIRTVDYADLVWLVEDAMLRFTDNDPNPKTAKTYMNGSPFGSDPAGGSGFASDGGASSHINGFDGSASSDSSKPRSKDSSRSGIAARKVVEWRSRAIVLTFDEMIEKLLADPETKGWALDYKDEPTQRQFHRLWERSRAYVNWTEHELAKDVREAAEAAGAAKQQTQEEGPSQSDEIHPEPAEGDAREPIDLFGNLTPEPVITRDMLPPTVADYVWEQSALLGCDPGAMAMAALTSLSALASDMIKVMPKRHDSTYLDEPRLWTVLSGEVSSRKTPLLKKVMTAVKQIEQQYRLEDARKKEAYDIAKTQYDLKRKIWDSQVAHGDKDANDAGQPQKPEKPPRRRLHTTDYTNESLALVLCDNPKGLLVLMDEIMMLFGGFDAYRAGSVKRDRPVTLELWNGVPRPIDRVRSTDEPIMVPNWGASILGCIQREVLDQIGTKLFKDGLMQRFMIIPVLPAGEEEDRRPNTDIISTYHMLVKNMADYNPEQEIVIRLSEAAQPYREEIDKTVAAFMVLPGLSEGFRGHAGKMGAIYARILLTMHVIEHNPLFDRGSLFAVDPTTADDFKTISGDTAQRAFRLMMKFIIPHAVRQYQRLTDHGGDQLGDDVRWIAGHILARSLTKIDKRVCQHANRVFKADPDRAQKALVVLREANWIINDQGNVNPTVHDLFIDRAAEERKTRDDKMTRIKRAAQHMKNAFYK